MGISWSSVSKDYNMIKPPKMIQYTKDEIDKASEMLAFTNLSYADITRITGVPLKTQWKIITGSSKYSNYPKIYDFSNRLSNRRNRMVE